MTKYKVNMSELEEENARLKLFSMVKDDLNINQVERFLDWALEWYKLGGKKLWWAFDYGYKNDGYVTEWAKTFNDKEEYNKASDLALIALINIDGKTRRKYKKQTISGKNTKLHQKYDFTKNFRNML